MDSISYSQTPCQENVKVKKPKLYVVLREVVQVTSTTILSLLLPLAFLLLARLKMAHYYYHIPEKSLLSLNLKASELFLYTVGSLQYVLVWFITGAALLHGITSSSSLRQPRKLTDRPVCQPCLYAAWIFLCVFQVCVGVCIEGSIAAGIDHASVSGFGQDKNRYLITRSVVFFLGLHETMLYWSNTLVKPIVDDTIFGILRKESWIQKVVLSLSFGIFWWSMLRSEIESLVMISIGSRSNVLDFNIRALMGIRVADSAGWLLYYLTVTIGLVMVAKAVFWVGTELLSRSLEVNKADSCCDNNDQKV